MIRKLSIFLFLMCHGLTTELIADSPITSTNFYKAYKDLPQVKEAMFSKDGILTKPIAKYLLDENVPIDHALAVINALSWNINGKNNAKQLENYFNEHADPMDPMTFLQANRSPRMMIIVAYLTAMDNYFDVEDARQLSKEAQALAPDKFSIAIISDLISTQKDEDGCLRYLLSNITAKSFKKKYDMRDEAVIIIMEYMNLYSKYCPQHVTNFINSK